MSVTALLSCALLCADAGELRAEEASVAAAAAPVRGSSLLAFVEDVARALEARAETENASGPLRLTVDGARGVNARRAEREFGARLERRLRDGGVLTPVARAPLRGRLVLS
jgi:hypothetical protein